MQSSSQNSEKQLLTQQILLGILVYGIIAALVATSATLQNKPPAPERNDLGCLAAAPCTAAVSGKPDARSASGSIRYNVPLGNEVSFLVTLPESFGRDLKESDLRAEVTPATLSRKATLTKEGKPREVRLAIADAQNDPGPLRVTVAGKDAKSRHDIVIDRLSKSELSASAENAMWVVDLLGGTSVCREVGPLYLQNWQGGSGLKNVCVVADPVITTLDGRLVPGQFRLNAECSQVKQGLLGLKLDVSDACSAGDYRVRWRVAGPSFPTKEYSLRVRVRHFILWPILVVGLGVIASFLTNQFVSRLRPSLALKDEADALWRKIAAYEAKRLQYATNAAPLDRSREALEEAYRFLGMVELNATRQSIDRARAAWEEFREDLLGEANAVRLKLVELKAWIETLPVASVPAGQVKTLGELRDGTSEAEAQWDAGDLLGARKRMETLTALQQQLENSLAPPAAPMAAPPAAPHDDAQGRAAMQEARAQQEAGSMQAARREVRRGDIAIACVSVVIASLAGLKQLYFGRPFGTMPDYIGLLLWGFGTNTALMGLPDILGKFSTLFFQLGTGTPLAGNRGAPPPTPRPRSRQL